MLTSACHQRCSSSTLLNSVLVDRVRPDPYFLISHTALPRTHYIYCHYIYYRVEFLSYCTRSPQSDVNYIEPLGSRKLLFKSYWKRVCVNNAFFQAGFESVDTTTFSSKWTALWAKHQNSLQMQKLSCLQKVNHFQASWCVGRKDRLLRTLHSMKRQHGSEFDFHPESYVLPTERNSFMRKVHFDLASAKSNAGSKKVNLETASLWICKPCASSCGKGIKVLTSSQALALPKAKKALLQRYLQQPYLIADKKFDLRIYVVITGVDPLRVYVHNEGMLCCPSIYCELISGYF